jgi:tetratricopeptide (TPR) repeat protein
MSDFAAQLATAFRAHQAGELNAAERDYRALLSVAPQHAEARHLLGVLLHQTARHAEAVEELKRAIAADGTQGVYHNHLGAALGASGETDAAEVAFREALRLMPGDAQTHYNLAALAGMRGDAAAAGSGYREAVRLNPKFAEAWFNLGNVLRDQRQYGEAADCYRQALAANPRYLKAGLSLGAVLRLAGRLEESADAYRQLTATHPRNAEAHFRLGSVLQEILRPEAAGQEFQTAIQLQPDHADAHNNLGCIYREQENYVEAVASFRLALDARPDFAEALANLGSALAGLGRTDESIVCYERSLELKPELVAARINLGAALHGKGLHEHALAELDRAIDIDPQSADAHSNRGAALLALDRVDEALVAQQRALELKPDHADSHYNLGAACQVRGDWEEAICHYHDALRLKPDYAEAHYSNALIRLTRGEFAAGWRGYEWRLRCKRFVPRGFSQPRWDGSPLSGRTLLVHAEQGLGDTIQFVRYVRLLAGRDARVIVEVPKALHRLLLQSGFDNLIPRGEPLPHCDVQIPLLSLPLALTESIGGIPAEVPYLTADPALVADWAQRLKPLEGIRIGINWQGNPEYTFDRFRSVPLAQFAPIAAVPGVRLISLQKQVGLEQIAEAADRFEVLDLDGQLDVSSGPFLDTVAVMKNLDLVISSDSAVAHLAGALGVPVWLATSYAAEWRWQVDRPDCPWYPTMRLFRQPALHDWGSVFEQMAEGLVKG